MTYVTGNYVRLPIFHVYFPTTLPQVLDSFLKENEVDECLLLGHVDVELETPVKREKGNDSQTTSRSADGKEKSMFSVVNKTAYPASSGAKTRSKSRSKSRSKDKQKSSTEGSISSVGESSSQQNYVNVVPPVIVYSVSIVGITSRLEDVSSNCGVQVVGKLVAGRSGVNVKRVCNPMLNITLLRQPGESPRIFVETALWNDTLFHPNPDHLIMFDYDPTEFQQWKVPQGYPLGLPKIVLDGISMFQPENSEEFNFTPAFMKVDQDYQDLNACGSPPGYIKSNPVLNFMFRRSSGLQQIFHKLSILVESTLGNYAMLPTLNFFLLIIVDSMIGYVITSYLVQLPSMLSLLHVTVDEMLAKLNHLLRWLRGAPAGLKLNPNLNSLYWRFFSYHIHLWANYIGILEPIFAIMLNTIQYYGYLGATIQISFIKDLFSLATFHVYCLYIYATRLYSLQITAIKALCRVFFGRKYNPLRNRIDHVKLTTVELFLSSFGFVLLIFLFPTTMVYYAGFVCLRVPVLLVERTLQYLVSTFNILPFVSWGLVYLSSPRVADEIYLLPRLDKSTGALTFRVCLRSTRTLLKVPDFGKAVNVLVGAVTDGKVLKE